MDFLHDDNFNPGAVKEIPDIRTATVKDVQAFGAMGAPAIDWEKGFDVETSLGFVMPTVNQGTTLSCVGQAWRYYAQALEYKENKAFTPLSARDMYSQMYLPQGGAQVIDGAKILTKKGVALAIDMPDTPPVSEDAMRSRKDATEQSIERALRYKAKSYAMIPNFVSVERSMEEAAQTILENFGAVTGAEGTNPGWREKGGIVRPPLAGEKVWGHGIWACGFRMLNGKKAIKFKNSWSDAWGSNGYGWLTEDYFASGHTFGFYTVVDLPDSWINAMKNMLNLIKEPGTPNLYIVSKNDMIYKMTDQETWKLLIDLGMVGDKFAEPTPEQFANYHKAGNFPSKLLTDTLAPIAPDVFGLK